jgi:DNA-binding transcriptional LysR family regulator
VHADQLPHLETFAEAAERGSFTAAARALDVTQAAVSQRVQQLEAALDAPLFERRAGRVMLTEAGRRLHPIARRILDLHAEARASVYGRRAVVGGELHLAASSVPGDHLLPPVVAAFRKRHPQVRVRVEGGDTAAVLRLLAEGQVHLAVVGGRTDSPHLDFKPFACDRLVVVVGPAHPWRLRRRVSVAELRRQPLILREEGSGSRACLERALASAGRAGKAGLMVALELGTNEAVKQAVAQGEGVAVLSGLAVRQEVEAGRLHALEVTGLRLERPIFVATDRRRALPLAAQTFLTYLAR